MKALNTSRFDIVIVKLGAVLILVYALQNLAYYTTFLMGGVAYTYVAAFIFCLVFLLPAAISWVLWRFPATVSGAPFDKSESSDESNMGAKKALFVGVTLIGLYTLIFGLIDLLYFEAQRYAELQLLRDAYSPGYPVDPQTIVGRVTNIAQVVLGGILIYGRHGISAFLHQVRTAGVKAS